MKRTMKLAGFKISNFLSMPEMRNGTRYAFDSTEYLYHGLECEQAPKVATVVSVKNGVETIGETAFRHCTLLPNFSSCEYARNVFCITFIGDFLIVYGED